MPDIKDVCMQIGAEPTAMRDGEPWYTLPVIKDPSTNKVVSDSMVIAIYLDETYPNTPPLMSAGSHILHHAFQATVMDTIGSSLIVVIAHIFPILSPCSQEYFRSTRERWYRKKLEELSPPGSTRMLQWESVEASFGKIDDWFRKFEDPPFFMGETLSFADIFLGSFLKWMQRTLGAGSEEWQQIKKWHGGRWMRILDQLVGLKSTEEL